MKRANNRVDTCRASLSEEHLKKTKILEARHEKKQAELRAEIELIKGALLEADRQ